MKFSYIVLMAIINTAFASDEGFRNRKVDSKYGCFNKRGKPGLNPDYFGECGEHKGTSHPGISLVGKYMAYSDFSGADFSYADLSDADLLGSVTTGTNFSNAVINSFTFLPFSRTEAYEKYGMTYQGPETERYCCILEYSRYCEGEVSDEDPPYN